MWGNDMTKNEFRELLLRASNSAADNAESLPNNPNFPGKSSRVLCFAATV
jgi:hypothetical protein